MDSSDILILTGRLERESDDHPQLHLFKVGFVAVLGYLPIATFALGLLIALISLIYSLIFEGSAPALAVLGAVACAIGLALCIRALLVDIALPAGREIVREEAPALFATIDDVVQRMSFERGGKQCSVPVHAVMLDASFDAKLHQIPRWSVFGKYENYLQLGVPLLAALNIAELKAVLAHEIGHLGGEPERLQAWIYRQRLPWKILHAKFIKPETAADRLLAKFYSWYSGYFDAYTAVLARKLEFSADRAAARATHPGAIANALTKLALMGRFLEEEFWPKLMAQVEKTPEPPYLPYSMMPRAFGLAQKQWSRQDWLERSLRTFPAPGDTHPSLGDRFAALNIQPAPPTYSTDRSSLSLFGADSPTVLKWCDEEWKQDNAQAWRKRHEAIGELRWKIAEYEKTAPADLAVEDLWQKTLLILDLGQYQSAIEELQYLVTREPKLSKAHLLLGKLLLQHGDEQGLQSLMLAATHDAQVLDDAGGTGYSYLMERGRKGEAQRFWDRICAA